MEFFDKTPRLFRNEVYGFDYTFDCDIEIFVSLGGEIEDVSGCGEKTAKRLIAEAEKQINKIK